MALFYQFTVLATTSLIIMLTSRRMPSTVHGNPDKRPLFRRSHQSNANAKQQAGLTLGDLDVLEYDDQSSTDRHYTNFNSLPFTENQFIPQQYSHQDDASTEGEDKPHQIKRSLRRINLDLSGRIMCQVFSPGGAASQQDTAPLFCLPRQSNEKEGGNISLYNKFIPRIFIGAHYDLDEIWYGATRWIGKCSWGPSIPKYESVTRSDSSLQSHIANRVRNAAAVIFPTSSLSWSNWVLDVEGERSVFDPADITASIGLRQPRNDIASSSRVPNQFHHSRQKLTLEYDSSKYYDDHYRNSRRDMQYSPVVTMNVQTPLFHPRIEFHSKHTWVVKNGGDKMGNYYGGSYYGSDSPAEQRLQQIKAGYRDGIPRANQIPAASLARDSSSQMSSFRKVCCRISSWIENDEWMPKKVTTDLMGNLVSVNEVGFGAKPKEETSQHKTPGLINNFIPPRHNIGLRLRISKKIDWSKLGIFPWNNNSYESALQERRTTDKQAMRVRLELCGLNESEDNRAWIAIDADPFDAIRTFRVIAGQEATSS